jgi:hypothetical protein
MSSVGGPQLIGQFMHPIIDSDTQNDDPWRRNYFQPPQFKKLVPRNAPLIDIRPSVSEPNYLPDNLLKTHGFGIVKHRSTVISSDLEALGETNSVAAYHEEIQLLVKETTGAKEVFVLATVLRRGKRAPEAFTLPKGLARLDKESAGANESSYKVAPSKSEGSKLVALVAPVRVPHLDFTPLGARQTIRFQGQEIYNCAVGSGVISAENQICQRHGVLPQSKESDSFVARHYNENGKLGPRYAAYSVWRPLRRVVRDPLSLAPRKVSERSSDYVYWPYENKIPGTSANKVPETPELDGDFLKEFAMLGVQKEFPQSSDTNLKFYYISDQEPDEVLLVKLFDSAALGEETQHAGAPWHASPEIGSVPDDHPRESIELRVLAFW